jgi:protein tyrosine phosphatase
MAMKLLINLIDIMQGPLPNTAADFWQMVWEQGSVVIVNLTRLSENTTALCHRYWPEEGSELHHIYEVIQYTERRIPRNLLIAVCAA